MNLADSVLVLGLLAGGTVLALTGSAAASPVEGTWRTLNGSEIFVQPCDEGYCGSLSHIVIPPEQSGLCRSLDKDTFAPLILDYNNTDRALQTRSLLGAQMLTLRPTGDPNSFVASIYNAQDGKIYDGMAWVLNDSILRFGGGCVASICAVTQDWPKVPDREAAPDFSCSS